MKKRIAVVLTAIIMSVACLTGCQSATKNYGGKTTVKLEPNQKLEEITWKDDSLWYLTRPMTDDDVAETHTFRQQRDLGAFEGTVRIIRRRKTVCCTNVCRLTQASLTGRRE